MNNTITKWRIERIDASNITFSLYKSTEKYPNGRWIKSNKYYPARRPHLAVLAMIEQGVDVGATYNDVAQLQETYLQAVQRVADSLEI